MRIAVVGTGNIVKKFLYGVSKTKSWQCVAVCSRKEESAQKFIGSCDSLEKDSVRICTDYDVMLTEVDIDLIYIALPNSLHYSYTKKALLAGKHVVCEKPFTIEPEETAELIRLATERRLYLFEAITTRNLPNYQIVKDYLSRIGQVRMVQCNFSQYSSRYDEYLAGEMPNVFSTEYAGGALNDLNIYNLHFVVGLFGKPQGSSYHPTLGRNGIDLSGVALLQYDGFQAVLVAAKDSASPNQVLIQGEKGYIRVQGESSRCRLVEVSIRDQAAVGHGAGDRATAQVYGAEQTEDNVLYYEVQNFEDIMSRDDYEACQRKLSESMEVMEVLGALR